MTEEEIKKIFSSEIESLSETLSKLNCGEFNSPTKLRNGKVEVVQHGNEFYVSKQLNYAFITRYSEESVENMCTAIKFLADIEISANAIFQKIWELSIQKGDTP